ncbi:MAG: helix-turn-helix domain-containing protein [Pseudomonadota bacterium]
MLTDFALDLRLARRRSGLSQHDVAHLLAVEQSTLSRLEQGKRPPTVRQFIQLSLIYGRSFRSLLAEIMREVKPELALRLDELPQRNRPRVAMFNRAYTLKGMRARLADDAHGGA